MNKLFSGKIWRASLLLGLFTLLAKVSGLVRDRVLASQFGASTHLDIYYSAFRLPDLIFNLFILGAISSAFVPIFLEYYHRDEERAWKIAQNFLNVAVTAVIGASVLIFIFAWPLSFLVAPGFSNADRTLLVQLIRLMLFSPLIFAFSTVIGSILQALERFVAYAAAPIVYNIGIMIGALYLVPWVSVRGYSEVLGLGLGVILGALLHLLIQLPVVLHAGFRFGMVFGFADDAVRKILKLMAPRTVGTGAYSVESIVTNAFASTMPVGSITILNLADSLQFVPISVLGVSMATAVFPRLSAHASASERFEFREKLNEALRNTFTAVTVIVLLMFFLRRAIIRFVFEAGAFRSVDASATASVLGIFLFGVIAQSLIPIMSRGFYALQDTRTPVAIALGAIALNVILGGIFTLVFHWGVGGLATSFAIAGNLHFLTLYSAFRAKYF